MKIIGANITGSFILNNQDVTNTLQSSSVWSGSVAAEINSLNTFTASAATTGSNTFNGNQIVSGSLTVTGSITTPGTLTAQTLIVQTITSSQDFVTGSTKFGSIISNTHQFTGSISVSGSLAVNDSNVILTNQTSSMSVATASFVANAQTASYVENAQTASFVTLAQTASFVANAQSASNAVNAQTASLAQTASFVSLAQTASYVENAQTASFVATSQTASFVTLAQTASFVANAQSASNAVNAATASFVTLAQTASFVTLAQTASFVTTAQTASFVTLAQTASFVTTAQTASFVANAQSASNAVAAQTASFANSFTVANTLTAQTLVVQTITSSVDFVTGSTQFGSLLSNTHVFSGSVTMNPGGLFVSSSGVVGIGTTSPNSALDVRISTSQGGVAIGGGATTSSLQHGIDGNSRYLIVSGPSGSANLNYGIVWVVNNTTESSGSLMGVYAFGQTVSGKSGTNAGTKASISGFTSGSGGSVGGFGGELRFYTRPNNAPNDVGQYERMRITMDGAIGVGTTSPVYQFDISTSNYKSLRIQSSDDALITIGSTIASSQFYSIGVSSNTSGQGANLFWIGTSTNNPSGALTKNFTITSTGAVTLSTNVSSAALALDVSNSGTYGLVGIRRGTQTNASAGINYYTTTSQKWFTGIYENTDNFGFYNAATANFPVVITTSNTIGLGTTSPNNRLTVNGNADFGTTSYSFNGPSQYGGLTFPRGQLFFSNTNSQNQLYIASNAYNNASGVFAYRNSSQPALAFGLDNGEFSFLTAGNGTADATISWTTVIAITNGGNVTMGGTGATKLQSGTTAQRPSAAAGLIRYNTSLAELEMSNGSNWGSLQTKVVLGSSPSNPAESANDIKTYYPNATNGFYWIRQTGSTATSAYCVFRDATGAEIAGGPWTVPIISNDANSNFSTNGVSAASTFLSKCQAIGINTPGRGMESSRTTTEVYGAWLAVKRTIWEAYTPFMANGNTSGGSVLRMPMININGEGGASAHRLIYNTSLSTHLPPNESGDACNASQLFCGWWGATDTSSWRTNDNNVPGPEDWGPSDSSNAAYNGAGVQSTLTVCVYK